jgi:hypothetical protein
MVDYIHNYEAEKPKQPPVEMSVSWPNEDKAVLYASNAEGDTRSFSATFGGDALLYIGGKSVRK